VLTLDPTKLNTGSPLTEGDLDIQQLNTKLLMQAQLVSLIECEVVWSREGDDVRHVGSELPTPSPARRVRGDRRFLCRHHLRHRKGHP
jgi:hypothetical protein